MLRIPMNTRHCLALVTTVSVFSFAACDQAPAPKPPAPHGAATPAPALAPSARATVTAAAPAIDPSTWKTSSSADDANTLEVAGFRAPKPASWVWTKPSVQFRTLQYAVAGDGDSTQSADFIVSVFLAGDGGPLEANIERWRSQFRVGDKPPDAVRSSKTLGPLQIELIELAGEYLAMGAVAPRADYLQLAAIIQANGRNVFFRLVGPKATVEANREAFMTLVDGIIPAN